MLARLTRERDCWTDQAVLDACYEKDLFEICETFGAHRKWRRHRPARTFLLTDIEYIICHLRHYSDSSAHFLFFSYLLFVVRRAQTSFPFIARKETIDVFHATREQFVPIV